MHTFGLSSLFALLTPFSLSNASVWGWGCPSSSSRRTSLSMAEVSGPRSRRRKRPSRRTSSSTNATGGPRPQRVRQERPLEEEFDGKKMTALQDANENAPALNLESVLLSDNNVRCLTEGLRFESKAKDPAFTFMSLDDLFGEGVGLSEKFNSDVLFRQDLRSAIRQDIFDTTPFYANLSEKAASVLLLPDSSLEGSWRIPETMDRMKKTTEVLSAALGEAAPTGDELFRAISRLCGTKPSTHFIDIYGVQDRKISHSFHLDFGKSPESTTQTVLWGFPREDGYDGCGVFSHIIPLENECLAPDDLPRMEPVLFDGIFNELNIVRPRYQKGRELLIYRDIDVLHSAPDVTYRTSVMRFM